MITKKFSVQIPGIPNFIRVGEQQLSIAEFSESELRAIGREWTAELIKHGKKKRATRPRGTSQTSLTNHATESLHDAAHQHLAEEETVGQITMDA